MVRLYFRVLLRRANDEKSRSDPKPGETLELGFLGMVINVEIPHTIDQFQLTETSSFNEKYDPKLHVGHL